VYVNRLIDIFEVILIPLIFSWRAKLLCWFSKYQQHCTL